MDLIGNCLSFFNFAQTKKIFKNEKQNFNLVGINRNDFCRM